MNAEENRTCPFCAETIKAAAKVCPRCRQPLTLRSARHPAMAIWFVMVPTSCLLWLVGFGLISKMDRMVNPKPNYSEFLGSLRVTESLMNWVQTSNDTRIYLTGIVTNQSAFPWKEVELDCRFFDAEGILVDAASGRTSFTIEPHSESAFRVAVTPLVPTNKYISFKVSVNSARNARSAF